jgi:two-component system sensor histidine kinase UhpB
MVVIDVYTDMGYINLRIVDNGKGFVVTKKRSGIGLTNILNRIESYNGTVTINSKPGNGCTLTVQVPFAGKG